MSLRSLAENLYMQIFRDKSLKLNKILSVCPGEFEYDKPTVTDPKYFREKEILRNILDDSQKVLLSNIEQSWLRNVKWATNFAFHQGVAVRSSADYSNDAVTVGKLFTKHVYKECLSTSGTRNYPEYYLESNFTLMLFNILDKQLDNEDKVHLYAIGCSWAKKVYDASYDSFRIGFLTAPLLIRDVKRRKTENK